MGNVLLLPQVSDKVIEVHEGLDSADSCNQLEAHLLESLAKEEVGKEE